MTPTRGDRDADRRRRGRGIGHGADRGRGDRAEPVSLIDEPTEAPAELALDPARTRPRSGRGVAARHASTCMPRSSRADERPAEEPWRPRRGARSWLTRDEEAAERRAKPARTGGTLFERMSNIARGAAKAQVEEEEPTAARRARSARHSALPEPPEQSITGHLPARRRGRRRPVHRRARTDWPQLRARGHCRYSRRRLYRPDEFSRDAGLRRGLMLLASARFGRGRGQQQPPTRARQSAAGRGRPAAGRHRPGRRAAAPPHHARQNPRSLEALIGAGRAALDMGDGQALDHLLRPRRRDRAARRAGEGRHGLGLGPARAAAGGLWPCSAKPMALGAPEAEIAGDRGLAYDMIGDPGRAQQDYALALRRNDDPELRRRMALSLAISGRREEALRVIDAQLRRNDRAAWRTQAFVLALTGDTAGANRTARSVMPAGSAEAMAPFFARLAALDPGAKGAGRPFRPFPERGRRGPGRGRHSAGVDRRRAPAPGAGPATIATEPAADSAATGARKPPRRGRSAARSAGRRHRLGSPRHHRARRIAPRPVRRRGTTRSPATRASRPRPPPRDRATRSASSRSRRGDAAGRPALGSAAERHASIAAGRSPAVAGRCRTVPPPTTTDLPPSVVADAGSADPGFSLRPQGLQPELGAARVGDEPCLRSRPRRQPVARRRTAPRSRISPTGQFSSGGRARSVHKSLLGSRKVARPDSTARRDRRRRRRAAPQRAPAAGAAATSEPPLGSGRRRRQPGDAAARICAAARPRSGACCAAAPPYVDARPAPATACSSGRSRAPPPPRSSSTSSPSATSRHLPGQARRARK